MKTFAAVYFTAMILYTAFCAVYGPPYNDAYGKIVHAAYTWGDWHK